MYGQRNMSDIIGQSGMNNQRTLGSDNSIASGGGIQFDAASFPVLSAVGGSNRGVGYGTNTSGSGSNQQDFSIQKEDFPALSGSSALGVINSKGDSNNMIQGSSNSGFTSYVGSNLNGSTISRDLTNQNQEPIGVNNHQSSNGLGVPGGMSRGGSVPNQQPSQGLSMASNAGLDIPVSGLSDVVGTSTRIEAASTSKESTYGLTGLLDVIRMTDRDRNTLSLGADLTTFGLNLNSNDCLYSSFTSPFTEQSGSTEPQFTTPSCYLMPPPTLKTDHLAKFQIETLFHMFYSMPRDLLQAVAAQELYRREWKYHSELRLWLKQRNPQELIQGHSNVQFLYFDVNNWEARLFTTVYRGNINQGLLSEEEIKIRQNPSLTSNQLLPP
jgi:CCR4-NOT transcription complex subunit 2